MGQAFYVTDHVTHITHVTHSHLSTHLTHEVIVCSGCVRPRVVNTNTC